VEITHRPKLRGASQSFKVLLVSKTLKISATDNQIYILSLILELVVHFCELTMKTTNLSNNHLIKLMAIYEKYLNRRFTDVICNICLTEEDITAFEDQKVNERVVAAYLE